MDRQQFLDQLRECLEEEIAESEITDTLNFYNDYILEEQRSGKTEEQVLASLGSPRLIAHSIIDAHGEAESEKSSGYYDSEEENYGQEDQGSTSDQLKSFAIKAGVIALIIAVIVLIFWAMWVLLPVIIIGGIALWLYHRFINS